jgi:hypothetical protein
MVEQLTDLNNSIQERYQDVIDARGGHTPWVTKLIAQGPDAESSPKPPTLRTSPSLNYD